MSKRRSALGKGLDALLPELLDDEAPNAAGESPALANIAVDQLFRGAHQPRLRIHDEGIDELAQSIRAQGVIEPLVVRPRTTGGYEIIAGERRWRAAQRAGLSAVPALVRTADDRQAVALALVENIQREDLGPLEEARALQRLLAEYALTHEQVAHAVGKSRTAVTNLLRLLNLAPAVRNLLDKGALEMGHARALLALDADAQAAAARRVIAGGLSVRQTEALVKRMLRGEPTEKPPADPDTRRLERGLSERFGAPVSIAADGKGRGRIVIRYANLDELDGILERMGAGLQE